MDKIVGKWFWLVVVAYFLGLVVFFFIGLGKIAALMFSDDGWKNLKDLFQMLSWSASVGGFLWAVKIYRDSEAEKRYERALDSFVEVQEHLKELSLLAIKRDQIMVLFSKLDNRLKALPVSDRKELEIEVSAFCRGVLKRIECSHIFGEVNMPVSRHYNAPDDILELDKKFKEELVATAFYINLAGFFVKDNNFLSISDDNLMVGLLTRLIKYSQPIVAENYFDSNGAWLTEKIDTVYISVDPIPASIIYLHFAGNVKRQKIFDVFNSLE